MFLIIPIIIFVIFTFLRALHNEMERLDQLRLNATLSNANATYFLAADEIETAWMTARALDNITSEGDQATPDSRNWEPDWKLVLGTFEHFKDENFEEFLIAAKAPYFVRNMILSATPTVTIERVFEGDYYYYDIDYDYPDPDYDHQEANDEEGEGPYQMVITSVTWMHTHVQRFRPGYSFVKRDYDGTDSKNVFKFVSPTVMVHYKEKEDISTNIVREFKEEGILMTIVNLKTGMIAKRHYRRLLDDIEE